MKKYIGSTTVGQFIINNNTCFGELEISESSAKLTIYLKEWSSPRTDNEYPTQIHGTLYDLTKVTLIDAFCLGRNSYNYQKSNGIYERSLHLTFDLHYIIFGESFLDEKNSRFTTLDFTVPNSNDLLLSNSFSHIINSSKDLVKSLITKDCQITEEKFGFKENTDSYNFGDNPEICIYTGAYILHEFKTPYGRLQFRNNPKFTPPDNSGFEFTNNISCAIDFDTPTGFWQSRREIEPLIQLLGLILGKDQRLNTYKLELLSHAELPNIFEVYEDIRGEDSLINATHPSERLIHIESEADEFESVLNNWLSCQEEWRFARSEFFSVFGKRKYNSDILIKVANLFDIIPDSAYIQPVELPDEVLEAKSICYKIFKSLPPSIEREAMLGALGRVGKKSLKHKIRDRLRIIQISEFAKLNDIELVINQSVDCRNFFVHGGRPKFDYIENFNQLCFFIDTLLFIYGVSEMIDAGWTFNNWKADEFNQHPFSKYLVNYSYNLRHLKTFLNV